MVHTLHKIAIITYSSKACQDKLLPLFRTRRTESQQVHHPLLTITSLLLSNPQLPLTTNFYRTSSKATTTYPFTTLTQTLPKILHQPLKSSRFYVQSPDSISMQSDTHRSQSENEDENHRKLWSELEEIYKRRVPGVTSAETKQKHAAL